MAECLSREANGRQNHILNISFIDAKDGLEGNRKRNIIPTFL